MNISLNWLRALIPDLEGSAEELAHRLSMTAVTVDQVEALGAELDDVVVARVTKTGPHPNADRLTLCKVDAGRGEDIDVVCGAPVVVEGAVYPYVPAGGQLPGGFKIESRKIRGEMSHGMLCSEMELGLGRDKAGIMRLDTDAEPGTHVVRAFGLPDARYELDLTANRVDLACHVGVARELAPAGVADVVLPLFDGPDWEVRWESGAREASAGGVMVTIEDPERCFRYLGAVIRGVRVGPSPAWLAARLLAVGSRPISNVVDATNYVLRELNQPLHAFDLSRLAGSEIRVRAAEPGEKLQTLDGETHTLDASVTVIADRDRAVALAGVMGGADSEVGEETTDLLIECAAFDPRHTRNTARRTGLATDASYRFERGIDEAGLEAALVRCVELILAVAGGEAEPMGIRAGRDPLPERVVGLRPARVQRVLGLQLSASQIVDLLTPLGFSAQQPATDPAEESPIEFRVPTWRGDISEEVDLIEEVARRYGYDNFPEEDRWIRPSSVPDDEDTYRETRVRETLSAHGLLEARSSSFVTAELAGAGGVPLLDPLSADESHLRTAVMPVLLRRLEHNLTRGRRDTRLFEIGTVFLNDPDSDGVLEETRVGAVLTGRSRPPHWSESDEAVDEWEFKGLANDIADRLLGGRIEPADGSGDGSDDGGPGLPLRGGDWLLEPSYRILIGDQVVGVAGRVRDDAYDAQRHGDAVWGFEFRLNAVRSRETVIYESVSTYPAVLRDLALAVRPGVPAADIASAIREAAPESLEWLELFDVYEDEAVETGRSLAWSFVFRASDRTLTDKEVDSSMKKILAMLEKRFDARIRKS